MRPCACNPGLDRPLRHTEAIGNLGVRQAIHEGKLDHLPLAFGQEVEGPAHLAHLVPALQLIGGAARIRHPLEGLCIDGVHGRALLASLRSTTSSKGPVASVSTGGAAAV